MVSILAGGGTYPFGGGFWGGFAGGVVRVWPVFIILSLYLDRWLQAGVFLIFWLVSCLLTRSKWFQVDSKEILNDQENI
jgi:hypothetical protein